jgi:hypothetical protein
MPATSHREQRESLEQRIASTPPTTRERWLSAGGESAAARAAGECAPAGTRGDVHMRLALDRWQDDGGQG